MKYMVILIAVIIGQGCAVFASHDEVKAPCNYTKTNNHGDCIPVPLNQAWII